MEFGCDRVNHTKRWKRTISSNQSKDFPKFEEIHTKLMNYENSESHDRVLQKVGSYLKVRAYHLIDRFVESERWMNRVWGKVWCWRRPLRYFVNKIILLSKMKFWLNSPKRNQNTSTKFWWFSVGWSWAWNQEWMESKEWIDHEMDQLRIEISDRTVQILAAYFNINRLPRYNVFDWYKWVIWI
jgi:hypothetical protein